MNATANIVLQRSTNRGSRIEDRGSVHRVVDSSNDRLVDSSMDRLVDSSMNRSSILDPRSSIGRCVSRGATVIVSVYGSDPARGSEPGVGFHWLKLHLSLGRRVIALVHRDRRGGVERTREAFAAEIAEGSLIIDEVPLSRLQRVLNAVPGCYYLFYRFYQREVLRHARRWLNESTDIAFAHHVTMNGFREPGLLWRLPVPFVWGPIGGAQNAAAVFLSAQRGRARSLERLRTSLNRLMLACAPRARQARRRARLIFAANGEARDWASAGGSARVVELLETAVESISAADTSPERGLLLWVGNDEARKNPEFALLAFSLLARQRDDVRLMMVGMGAQRAGELRRFMREHAIPADRIDLRAALPREQLTGIYAQAGQFWFTSYRDTSGNVLLEAMSAGVPALAFAQHGAAAILRGCADNAITVSSYPRMLHDWMRASARLLDDEHAWRRNSSLMRERIAERYTWDRTTQAASQALSAANLCGARQ
jgi:glycosyltransferase involved in cell wall biosynthesis